MNVVKIDEAKVIEAAKVGNDEFVDVFIMPYSILRWGYYGRDDAGNKPGADDFGCI